ncbi:MOSC N-terminal beta barrel domain-containing protein [Siccirubricoccus deserti]
MRVENIYRYPVKGLTAEALEEVTLTPGACLPHDRRFALAQGDAPLIRPHRPGCRNGISAV